MRAKKCDRCGGYYDIDKEKTGGVSVFSDRDDLKNPMSFPSDLCPNCMLSFRLFMEGGAVVAVPKSEIMRKIHLANGYENEK